MRFLKSLLAVIACALSPATHASGYPARPIQVVVPYGPGGAVDVLGRIIGEHMAQTLGQPIVILNRPGGNANIGPGIVAEAQPDGYTLLASSAALIVNPFLDTNIKWNVSDFVPVARYVQAPNVLVVPASSKFATLADFVAHARANPGLTTNVSGAGNSQAIAREYFAHAAGIKFTNVAYKGGTSYIPDLISGTLSLSVAPLNVALTLVREQKLNALAITSKRRSSMLPDLPTIAEAGYPDATSVSWYGLHARAGTPPEVIQQLSKAVRAALEDPQVQARIAAAGAEIAYLDTPAFGEFLAGETSKAERFARMIKGQ
ncbi:tripartite tricarboxylate transporter substrate binding protein [Burkholderiaceae bacterium FT117]|uniref:tripartite tricarboxylate transporter substrate binding protein n=1 Tax=Zeimonas sediminis TaxID=2944268 RepID=UPI002342FFB0|nr:tripartite tricarboxylate transporter substrate binding protein [Zeimonas sediminis]MCM5571762.1 tripartite tricarboxylate transporter substrate binding protein [Zeimonas sediminis]